MGIALPFEQRFSMGFPQQRGTAAMVGLQADNQGAVIIGIEFGPVHGDYDLGAFTDHIGNPIVKEAPDIELGVSEQAIHLFNRMFTFETVGQGEATTDGVDGQ